jgi:hypothetical protein
LKQIKIGENKMIIKNGVLENVKDEDIIDGKFIVPEKVTVIGELAFSSCTSLKSMNVEEVEMEDDIERKSWR